MKHSINTFVPTNLISLSHFLLRGPSNFGRFENITQRVTAAFGKVNFVKLLIFFGTVPNAVDPLL